MKADLTKSPRSGAVPAPERTRRPSAGEQERTGAAGQHAQLMNGSARVAQLTELAARCNGGDGEKPARSRPAKPDAQPARMPLQMYSVREAPENKQIYAHADNGKMATGMGTPNHEFYVADREVFPVMNKNIASSPLELAPRSVKRLFGVDMTEVGLQYKTERLVDEGRKEQIKLGTVKKDFWESSKTENMQRDYEQNVLPNIKEYRETLAQSALTDLTRMGLPALTVKLIRSSLYELMESLNLFKKVYNAELANKGDFDEDTAIMAGSGLTLVQAVEEPLYKNDLTLVDLKAAKQTLLETWFDEDDRDNPNVVSKVLYRVLDSLSRMTRIFPDDRPVNMMPFHKANFNLEMLQKLHSPDNIALYRACDVQASTLLGNQLTPENAHRLKNYNANSGGAFHYATKIVSAGNDWVTLEHFAASQREREISGTTDTKFKNLDHTWQFIMQGHVSDWQGNNEQGLSTEDKYFEVYTKIRYYLKGITDHQLGGFDTVRRDRIKQMRDGVWAFVQVSGNSDLANLMGWRAFYRQVADKGKEKELEQTLADVGNMMSVGGNPLVNSKTGWDNRNVSAPNLSKSVEKVT